MKKLFSIILILAVTFPSIMAFDLKSILGKSSSSSTSSAVSAISNIISTFTSNTNIDLDDLTGSWKYSSPAVTFKSDNALQSIGGATAASALEKKLSSYYSKAGMTNLVLTVDSDHAFTMKMKLATLKGTITKDSDGTLTFNFSALGSYSLGKVTAYASKSGNTLTLTFDASKVISIAEKIAAVSGNSTFKTLSSLLSSYDGLYAGYKLSKQ
jgi:hypothetical protein